MADDRLHVAVGVITNARGEVLLGQRPPGKHLAGYWEFPGGKLEAGETARQALTRELAEELGIAVQRSRPLIQIRHSYPERSVLLDTWLVDAFDGEIAATGPEGQPLRWVPAQQLADWQLPPADRPIVNAIRLPDRYLITPSELRAEELLAGISRAIEQGISLIQLRGVAADNLANAPLLKALIERCRSIRLVCNVASVAQLNAARRLGFAGVHLKSPLLMQLEQRPVADTLWLGCSAHSAAELRQAAKIEADFAVLSPVAATASHPAQAALGWPAAAALVTAANLPVYALGGMRPSDSEPAAQLGFQGIAAIRSLWPAG